MDKLNVVEVFIGAAKVGRIALTEQRLCAFEYDAEFLKTGFSISPYHLPLRSGLFVAARMPFRGGFGVFDDSLPDGWGRLVLDRYLRTKKIDPDKITMLQRLALVGTTGCGALEYHPDKSEPAGEALLNFDRLAAEAKKILTNEYTTGKLLATFYKYGGSSGGARPKVFVNVDGRQWLVKFRVATDPLSVGRTEYAYSRLARQCGIVMPETRLFEGKYFGVERFDRTAGGKVHTISAAGLLHADYRIPSLDYSVLLKVCLDLTKNMEEVAALFRLMVFNVAIANRDDHAKNFSFQYCNGAWRLSPAYDLLPSAGFNGYHTTTVNGQGEPSLKDVLQVAADSGLSKKRANGIIEQVVETCKKKKMMKYRFV